MKGNIALYERFQLPITCIIVIVQTKLGALWIWTPQLSNVVDLRSKPVPKKTYGQEPL